MVGTVDMSYPANKVTFGPLVKEYPSFAVRNAGYKTKMLTDKIVHRSFELKPIKEWGYLVTKEELGKSRSIFDEKKILKFYEKNFQNCQLDFRRFKTGADTVENFNPDI